MNHVKIDHLTTEKRNPLTMDLDQLSAFEVVSLMNQEDAKVADAVNKQLPAIAKAVKLITKQLKLGGRVIYFGAGTSGRLGVIDASECPPTFSTTDEFIGIIAGGDGALRKAVEGAEDSASLGVEDLKKLSITKEDVVIGIAASGRTPYVLGGLDYAKSIGANTVTVSCNPNSDIGKVADIAIDVEVGPEVLTGSTRLKAGTAQKMVLNMLSTASMVGFGKVYGNLMVDVNPSNLKLIERAKKIIMQAVPCDIETATQALADSGNKVKTAIVMVKLKCSKVEAEEKLKNSDGFIRTAIQ
jgi:N-acetylmuramic acid 6-phosphate etherase